MVYSHKFKKYRKPKNKVSSFHNVRHPLRIDLNTINNEGSETTLHNTLPNGSLRSGRCEYAITYIKAAYWSKGKITDPYSDDSYIVGGRLRKTLRTFLKKPELYLRPDKLQMKIKTNPRRGEWERISKFINFSKLARDTGFSRPGIRKHIKKAIYVGCLVISQDELYEYYKKHPYLAYNKDEYGRTTYFKKRGKKSFIYEEKLHYGQYDDKVQNKLDDDEIRKAKKHTRKTPDFFIA